MSSSSVAADISIRKRDHECQSVAYTNDVFYTNMFAEFDILAELHVWSLLMADSSGLYKAVGRNIRTARERSEPKLSQAKLAKRLGISRVSIVNIEAGRQHAPLALLWEIAEILETELALFIPRRNELLSAASPVQLDQKTIDQIRQAAVGDKETQQKLSGAISKLKITLESQPPRKEEERHVKPSSRSAR
jgi:DNA-binding XRE family transcriptional regulator